MADLSPYMHDWKPKYEPLTAMDVLATVWECAHCLTASRHPAETLCPGKVAKLAEERAAIVAYIRQEAEDYALHVGNINFAAEAARLERLADAIEAGEHHGEE